MSVSVSARNETPTRFGTGKRRSSGRSQAQRIMDGSKLRWAEASSRKCRHGDVPASPALRRPRLEARIVAATATTPIMAMNQILNFFIGTKCQDPTAVIEPAFWRPCLYAEIVRKPAWRRVAAEAAVASGPASAFPATLCGGGQVR